MLGLFLSKSSAQDQNNYASQSEFSIYCSSNMDGTGKCSRVDSGEAINCIIIPGNIIACRDKRRSKYECVQYGAILAFQTQFFCLPDKNNSIKDQLFDNQRTDAVPPPPLGKMPNSTGIPKEKAGPATINPFVDPNVTPSMPKQDFFQNAF